MTQLPRTRLGETVLSRFCACAFPKIVVPDGRCSVHAAGAFAFPSPRLCAVKVKLTIWFACAMRLLVSAHSSPRQLAELFSARATRRRQTDWSRPAGRGGDTTPGACAND